MRIHAASNHPPLSCFSRWAALSPQRGASGETSSLKIEAQCKQCGQLFVKYAYDRTARCEACRKGSGEL